MRFVLALVCFWALAGEGAAGEENILAGHGKSNEREFVLDRAGLLPRGNELNAICRELYHQAGIEMWLVTAPSLEESGPGLNGKEKMPLSSGAQVNGIKEHARAWLEELSQARPGRGILLFLVRDMSRLDIESGLLLNLPPASLEAVSQRIIVPFLRRGEYQEGLERGMIALAHLAAGQEGMKLSFENVEAGPAPKRFSRTPLEAAHLWILAVPAVIYLLARWRGKQKRKRPGA
jgi:uncharacterized membrane protein YgcG